MADPRAILWCVKLSTGDWVNLEQIVYINRAAKRVHFTNGETQRFADDDLLKIEQYLTEFGIT